MSERPPARTAIAGLILAAGASTRMGTPKAWLRIGNETFLERLSRLFSDLLSPVIAVTRVEQEFSLPKVTRAVNPDPERGMLSSLQCGLRVLPSTAAGVVFTPVDYPNLQGTTIARIVDTFRNTDCDVVIPVCGDTHGHPVCVSPRVIQDLLTLPVTGQARDAIHRYRETTVFVQVDDAGIADDIDTPADYRKLLQALL